MTGVVPDVNVEGHVVALIRWLTRSEWAEWWAGLGLEVYTFATLGWDANLPDRVVWNRCQSLKLVLVTDNRNQDGYDALETTLRDSVRLNSLPVATISDKEAFRTDRVYAERVTVDLLEMLIDIQQLDRYLGAGRVFLPLPHKATKRP